jgi:phosphoglycerate dehydrogenase-like enzyme
MTFQSDRPHVLWLTQRGERHQQWALEAAPPSLEVVIRREPPRDELRALLAAADYLVSERTGVVDSTLLDGAPRLKLVQRLGVQTWDIDLEAARMRGILVCKHPIHGCVMVAEQMVMQMLALLKRVREQMATIQAAPALAATWPAPRQCDEDWFAYNWSGRSGIGELANATVGILGFGEIGLELAQRLACFDCTILYHKRTRLPEWVEVERGIHYAAPAEIAAQADIVACLLPWQGAAYPIDAGYIAAMKPGAIFVHAGSGGVVDEHAVLAALQQGALAGAAFDTFNWEPMRPDDPLRLAAADPTLNLVLTPHTAAGGFRAGSSSRSHDYDNILAHLTGSPLRYRIA